MKTFYDFEEFIDEKVHIELTPRQKIAEIGKKQNDLKIKISELNDKKREKPEDRVLLDLQIELNQLKIEELDVQRKIMMYKL